MSDTLKHTDRVVQGQKQLAAETGDTIVIMSVDHALYCGLDKIGTDIWHRLAQPMVIADLCVALTATYRGDREQIDADVLELLSSMHAQGLIDVV